MDIYLYLAILARLQTKDRVARSTDIDDLSCPLCASQPETLDHLFFLDEVSSEIWISVLHWQGVMRNPTAWCDEVNWAMTNARGNSAGVHIYRMTLAAGAIWYWGKGTQGTSSRSVATSVNNCNNCARGILQGSYAKEVSRQDAASGQMLILESERKQQFCLDILICSW